MNVPNLRFPEFHGKWEEKKLENIIEFEKAKYNPVKEKESSKCVELEHLSQNTGQLLGFSNAKEQNSIKNRFKKGNILFGKLRPYLRKYWFAEFDGVCSSEIWVFNGKDTSNEFLFQMIQTNKFKYISNISSGSKMPRSDWNYMSGVKFNFPSRQEQNKISSFLSKVDEKIEKLEKKVELWKTYKKGMMQQLFSQQIRFKDENRDDYPEWEMKEAKEIFQNYSNKNHDGNLPILAVTQDKGVVSRDSVDIQINSSTKSVKSYKLIEPGNFVISLRSFQGGIEYSYIRGISSPAYTVLKHKIKIVDDFYKYYFKKEEFISKLNAAVIGIRDGKQISFSVFSEMLLPFPSISEQIKISSFLSAIDREIDQLNKKLNFNIEFKKGLLQQMFVN